MRKTGILGIAVLLAALFAATSFADGLRVGVIDINKVLNESHAGVNAKRKMESRYEELKKKVDAKQEEARALKEEIDKQKVVVGKEKLKAKEDALQAKVNELRQLTQEGEQEMQSRQGEATREILKRIEVQVNAVVKAQKLDLVLERSGGVVYFDDSMDITKQVLEQLDKSEKEGGAKKEQGAGKQPAAKQPPAPKKENGGGK
jgi:outer membrane protein